MKEIYKYIKIICRDLKIKCPKVEIKKSNIITDTTLAAYQPSNDMIVIKKEYENKYDLFFSIAHELRHKYQIENNLFDFEKYKQRENIDLKEYNTQEEEIDANSYAYIVMISAFGVKPLFNGLDKDTIKMIEERAKEIVEEEI